jgi:dUTP pyrophosphatase
MIKYFLDPPALPSIDLRFSRRSDGASGYDLMANIATERQIAPGARWVCHCGLYLEMPLGVEAQVRTRSGLARDHGVIVLNAPGTIDSDYRGEVVATLLNTDRSAPHTVLPGDRVAQIVFAPVLPEFHSWISRVAHGASIVRAMTLERVQSRDELSSTDRGSSGHGSTGR